MVKHTGELETSDEKQDAPTAEQQPEGQPIIWTPGFITRFGLTMVLGLSLESLLTQGWQSKWYPGGWVLLGHSALLAILWGLMAWRIRSPWIRAGSIFGCLWVTFTLANQIVNLHPFDQTSPIIAHLNASVNISLLALYICFSAARVSASRWDAWFFGLSLLISSVATIVAYAIAPSETRNLGTVEGAIAAIALILCILVWWLRPANWQVQPGPTFLFGLAPTILLILSIPNVTSGPTNLLFLQIFHLCLLLGGIRIWQAERVHA